jgi:hypothetical protein
MLEEAIAERWTQKAKAERWTQETKAERWTQEAKAERWTRGRVNESNCLWKSPTCLFNQTSWQLGGQICVELVLSALGVHNYAA